ncbi:hypothetical protein ACYZFO_18635 [Clostridioides difficile]
MSEEVNQRQQVPTDIENKELVIDEPLQQKIVELVGKQIEEITKQLKSTQEENKDLKQKHYKIEMQKKIKANGLEDPSWIDILYDEDEKVIDFKIEAAKKIIADEVQRETDKRIRAGSYSPPEGKFKGVRRSNKFDDFVKRGGR